MLIVSRRGRRQFYCSHGHIWEEEFTEFSMRAPLVNSDGHELCRMCYLEFLSQYLGVVTQDSEEWIDPLPTECGEVNDHA